MPHSHEPSCIKMGTLHTYNNEDSAHMKASSWFHCGSKVDFFTSVWNMAEVPFLGRLSFLADLGKAKFKFSCVTTATLQDGSLVLPGFMLPTSPSALISGMDAQSE